MLSSFACASVLVLFVWSTGGITLYGAFIRGKLCIVQGAWRGRQNASAVMSVVDSFFTATLSATLQHEIHARDTDLPLHSDKTHKLLSGNTTAVNMSFTVY